MSAKSEILENACPYGVYPQRCETYPACVCGRHVARAAENSRQLEEKRTQESKNAKPEITYLEGGRMTMPDFGARWSNVRLEVRCCCDAGRLMGWVDVPYDDLQRVLFNKRITLRQFSTRVEAMFARIEESNPYVASPPRAHQTDITLEVEEIVNASSFGRERYYAIKSHDVPIEELTRIPNFKPARPDMMMITPRDLELGLSGTGITGIIVDEYERIRSCVLCGKTLLPGYNHATCEECVASGKLL